MCEFSFAAHGMVFGKVSQELGVLAIETQIRLAERDGGSVCGRGFGTSARSPVIGVPKIPPHGVVFVIELHRLLEVRRGVGILAYLKMSCAEVGERFSRRPNAQRSLQ